MNLYNLKLLFGHGTLLIFLFVLAACQEEEFNQLEKSSFFISKPVDFCFLNGESLAENECSSATGCAALYADPDENAEETEYLGCIKKDEETFSDYKADDKNIMDRKVDPRNDEDEDEDEDDETISDIKSDGTLKIDDKSLDTEHRKVDQKDIAKKDSKKDDNKDKALDRDISEESDNNKDLTCGLNKVVICHKDKTICIARQAALNGHLLHHEGDHTGICVE